MATKRNRLHETVILARTNNQVPSTHNQNEGNWTLAGVEPVLAALEWRRVAPAKRGDPDVDGAAYEWPNNHKMDVVLFASGHALAVMENKDALASARSVLLRAPQRKVGEQYRARLDTCAWGLYSWHMEGGGFGWIPYIDGNLDHSRDDRLKLKDVRNVGDGDKLAQLARPVLTHEVTQSSWLATPVDQGCAIRPRFDLFAVQRHFFETLANELELYYGKVVPIEPCLRDGAGNRPTLSKAYSELPGLLPQDWGITYGLHEAEDYIQCLFYRGSTRHDNRPIYLHYPDGVPERGLVEEFIRSKLLPRIEQHIQPSPCRTGSC